MEAGVSADSKGMAIRNGIGRLCPEPDGKRVHFFRYSRMVTPKRFLKSTFR